MMLLLAVLLCAILLEGLLVGTPLSPRLRLVGVTVVVLLLAVPTAVLLTDRWPLWIGVWLLNFYHVINLGRYVEGRLPTPEIRRIVPRTLYWLTGIQLVVFGVSWWLVDVHWLRHNIDIVVAGAQLFVAILLLRTTVRTWRRTRLPHHIELRTDKDLPTLSVLIPARNETDDLEACLTTLVASDYPKLEIIVLDDCSVTKRTPQIIRMFAQDGVRFIAGEAPDEVNWLAKNQAYDRLSSEANGDLLLFCGVDVRFGRETLRQLVETLLTRNKQMLSVLPFRAAEAQSSSSLMQPMRYAWELSLPRRGINRPPVLSTCWIIASDALERLGGFKAVARKIVPEAYFARQLTAHDGYGFVRSNAALELVSNKSTEEQRKTTVRMRYPQLHRRIELVVLTALVELFFSVGTLATASLAILLHSPHMLFAAAVSLLAYCALLASYYYVAVRTKLNSIWLFWILFPFAVVSDVVLLHLSMWRYEFSTVEWKGRNICIPVMRISEQQPVSDLSEAHQPH